MTHEEKLNKALETLSKINKKWSQISNYPDSHQLKIKIKTQKEQFKELIKKMKSNSKQLLLPFEYGPVDEEVIRNENAKWKIDKHCNTIFSITGKLIQSGPPCDEEYLPMPDSVEKEYK